MWCVPCCKISSKGNILDGGSMFPVLLLLCLCVLSLHSVVSPGVSVGMFRELPVCLPFEAAVTKIAGGRQDVSLCCWIVLIWQRWLSGGFQLWACVTSTRYFQSSAHLVVMDSIKTLQGKNVFPIVLGQFVFMILPGNQESFAFLKMSNPTIT